MERKRAPGSMRTSAGKSHRHLKCSLVAEKNAAVGHLSQPPYITLARAPSSSAMRARSCATSCCRTRVSR